MRKLKMNKIMLYKNKDYHQILLKIKLKNRKNLKIIINNLILKIKMYLFLKFYNKIIFIFVKYLACKFYYKNLSKLQRIKSQIRG